MAEKKNKTVKDNSKNLIPINKRTKSEQREIAKKGGKASGQVRKQRKAFKDAFIALLESNIPNDNLKNINDKLEFFGVDTSKYTVNDYLVLAQAIKALSGDTKAFEVIRDTIGEKPTEKQEINNISEEQTLLKDILSQLGEKNE